MTEVTIQMRAIECYSCHMVFSMPKSFYDQCIEQKPHKDFYCPAGHRQHFLGENDNDKLRRERDQLKQQNARLHEEALKATREALAVKAELKRHKRRTSAGLCPCCNRSFVALARHIKTKHPDYNVVPLKAG